jgi:hypothetical protein
VNVNAGKLVVIQAGPAHSFVIEAKSEGFYEVEL